MKRIAISVVTLMAGSILSAQVSPQGAQMVQSQTRSAVQSTQAPSTASQPQAKSAAQSTAKPAAGKPVAAKPAANTASAAKPTAVSTAAKPAVASTAAAPAAKPVAVNSAAKAPVVAAVKPVAAAKAPAPKTVSTTPAAKPAVKSATKTEEATVKPAMVKTETPAPEPKKLTINASGRRDPFTSPVMRALNANQGPNCSSGKRCLALDQMTLRGIVRSPNGMIAVVENSSKRAYFLRENDPVWHGVVEKITGDSVVFKEESVDSKTGKSSTHEVVKRVNAPVV